MDTSDSVSIKFETLSFKSIEEDDDIIDMDAEEFDGIDTCGNSEPTTTSTTSQNSIEDNSNTYDSLMMHTEEHNRLEEHLKTVYGPTKNRSVYLYKELLDLIPPNEKPHLVFIDVQFVGQQLSEIAIVDEKQNFIFHRIYPTCNRKCFDDVIYNRKYNIHNLRGGKYTRTALRRKNLEYGQQYCSCRGKNLFHRNRIFNDVNYFRALPSGSNVIYVIRGLNKKQFLTQFMQKYNIKAHIRTYPLHLTTRHEKYTTCCAHSSSYSHCSVGNIAQMLHYYQIGMNLLC